MFSTWSPTNEQVEGHTMNKCDPNNEQGTQ
nr:MAG TPA: hypothetical protein [Caudoviricetes sp.]